MAGVIDIALGGVSADGEQLYAELAVPVGTTIHQALIISGWLDLPALQGLGDWCKLNADADPNHKAWRVGIYSQKKRLDAVLCDGDRIEIYRPLTHDPMAKRKQKSKSRMKSKTAKM